MDITTKIFILLAAYQLKHWLCDYRFQTPYMLGKFKPEGWLGPLTAHAGAHAFGTFIVATLATMAAPSPRNLALAAALSLADFVVHFIVDRIKVVAGRGLDATQPRFWRQLGTDQAAHHLTHYFIIYLLVTHA
jgi:hypothetical protein